MTEAFINNQPDIFRPQPDELHCEEEQDQLEDDQAGEF
jgi:hypothetical protein